ncbi:universal stress protein [Halostella salina]|uniref:universal stress protein n=1 Tax=Halostella salina TaxID=1547897 RepID=UPI000EF8435D|nr:universal stress protein [Halostella salina]
MSDPLFRRVVVPVASEEDAAATAASIAPHIDAAGGEVVAVFVVEKAGGAPDKASVEQREQHAETAFTRFRADLGDVNIETEIRYGTDVAAAIVEAARDADANAIAFTPRGGSRWVKLLTGDVSADLIAASDRPVVVLPDRTEDGERGA